jgi:hypothetical protein
MKRHKFNPRDVLFRNPAGLESLLAFKDDPDDDDSDHNPSSGDGATGGEVQGGSDPAGNEGASPGSSSSADADRARALELELAKERKARAALESEKQKREDEKKSELEKAQTAAATEREKREAAERNLEAMRVENALRTKALAAGVRGDRLEGALRLVNRSTVQVDDDGNLVGVEAAVEDVKKQFPEFFGVSSTSSPSTGGGKSGDRSGGDDGPQSDYEVGQALAKGRKTTKSRL